MGLRLNPVSSQLSKARIPHMGGAGGFRKIYKGIFSEKASRLLSAATADPETMRIKRASPLAIF